MKAASLLQTLILVAVDLILLWKYDINTTAFLILACGTIAVSATGLSFTVNSFMVKILVCAAISTAGGFMAGYSLPVCVILCCLAIHSASLWCESERAGGDKRWKPHYKFIHRMRHNWLGGLSIYAAIGICYVLIFDYYMHPEFISIGLLTLVPLVTVMYAEVNRVHNQSAFWVEVSGPLSSCGYYWKVMLAAATVLFLITWSFSTVGVEKILELREMVGNDNQNEEEETPLRTGSSTSGFQPGEIKLKPRVDIKLSNNPEFMVKFADSSNNARFRNRPFYVSAQELVTYTNSSWKPARVEGRVIRDSSDNRKDGKISLFKQRVGNVDHTIYLINPANNFLYSLTGLHTVHLPQIILSATGSFGIRNNDHEKRKKYRLESSYHNYDEIRDKPLFKASARSVYTSVPNSDFMKKIKTLTELIVYKSDTVPVKINKIRNYLQDECKYSLSVKNTRNRMPLDNFLFHEKKGHCVLFASAFTLMLRTAGIPSRMVNGYAGGEFDKNNKLFLVKGKNAHAWTEVFLDRYGWVVCDATPEASNIQPGQTRVKNFSEDSFMALGDDAETAQAATDDSPSFFRRNLNIILLIAVAMFSFFWQFIKKIPSMTFFKKEKKVKEPKRPPFIEAFENYCRNHEISFKKSATVRELLAKLRKKTKVDDEITQMVNYYYEVCFTESSRDESKEKSWQRLIEKKNRAIQ